MGVRCADACDRTGTKPRADIASTLFTQKNTPKGMFFKMVRKAGIEPAREKFPTDFKSVASTSSAIFAQNLIVGKCNIADFFVPVKYFFKKMQKKLKNLK